MTYSKNVATALAIIDDEIRGDVGAALKKMEPSYSMTWVYKAPKKRRYSQYRAPISKPT